MKKFSDLVKDNGAVTEEGLKLLEPFSSILEKILYSPEMRGLSNNDIKMLEKVLVNNVSNAISRKVKHK